MWDHFNSNDFALEIKSRDLQSIREQLDTNGRRMSLSVMSAALFIASSVALNQPNADAHGQSFLNYPIAFLAYVALACVFLIPLVIKAFKK
jgi:hypothetical protein